MLLQKNATIATSLFFPFLEGNVATETHPALSKMPWQEAKQQTKSAMPLHETQSPMPQHSEKCICAMRNAVAKATA